MYKRIMVPVDLTHAGDLAKALRTAADLANHYGCPVTYVAVTAATPTPVAHNPAEFAEKLAAFGEAQAREHGHVAETKAVVSHDPAIDLDDTLMRTIKEIDADLVVMQSHMPNITDYIWPSNGGTIATHSDVSVLVVR
jgi:nucleotide-binding universal stress UspA family protein